MKGKKRIIVTLLFFYQHYYVGGSGYSPSSSPQRNDLHEAGLACRTAMSHASSSPGKRLMCSSECMTRFYSPTPSIHTDSGPDYVFIATLFTDVIIEHLLRPQEKRIKNYYVYRDSLHGTDTHRTTSLRAPPYSVFA